MKKLKYLIFVLLLFPVSVLAGSKYVYIDDDVSINEEVGNSAVAFGGTVNVNNKIDGLGAFFGETVNYNTNSDYIAIFSNKVNLSGSFRDGAIFGNVIELQDMIINRDIVIFGNKIKINAQFNGNVLIFGSDIDINDSVISGDVYLKGNKVKISDNTKIDGVLKINSDASKSFSIDKYDIKEYNNINNKSDSKVIMDYVNRWVNILTVFLILYLLIPKLFNSFKKEEFGKNLGVGALLFVLVPIVGLILAITVFGNSIGIISILFYVIIIMMSKVITGYMLGNYIFSKYIKTYKSDYLMGVLGITIIYLISIIPYIGWVFNILLIIYTFGYIFKLIRFKKVKAEN